MEKSQNDIIHNEALPPADLEAPQKEITSAEYLNDEKRNRRLTRKLDVRLIPLVAWIFLLNYLDRSNIGNAKVLNQETGDDLLQQTNTSASEFAVAVSLFAVAYTVFEIPSNWIMKRYIRPSLWLGFLLFGWGVCTIGASGVKNYAGVTVVRILVGVFEAGFMPGVCYLIAVWYRIEERTLRVSFVVAHASLAGAFGGAIAYGIGQINRASGLEGFRWLFIIEGVISTACVVLVIFFLPDWPARARFLSEEEKKFAEERVAVQGGGYTRDHASRREILETCFSPRMLAHYLMFTLENTAAASFTFYTPTIVTSLGYKSLQAQLLTIPPWVVGYVLSLSISYSADRFNARGLHIVGSSLFGAAGWLTAALLPPHAYTARYGALILASVGAFPSTPSLIAWTSCNAPSMATMALAVALNNMGAGIGSIIAQWIWKASEADSGYPTGNFMCAVCSFVIAAVAIILRVIYGRMNKYGVLDVSGYSRVWAE